MSSSALMKDPEWFRIIATFYTYERAYSYCDIERVSVWTYTDSTTGEDFTESHTGEEELAGLRSPPIADPIPEGWMASRDGCADMVRNICEEAAALVPPHPDDDFDDQPDPEEAPEDYHARQIERGAARQAAAASEAPIRAESVPEAETAPIEEPPPEDEPDPMAEAVAELSASQWSVLQYFRAHAGEDRLIQASLKEIGEESGTAKGSTTFLVEALERKGFISIARRGTSTKPAQYRLHTLEEMKAAGDKLRCSTCGGPRSIGSASQCRACYQSQLAALPDDIVAELSKDGRREVTLARAGS